MSKAANMPKGRDEACARGEVRKRLYCPVVQAHSAKDHCHSEDGGIQEQLTADIPYRIVRMGQCLGWGS